MNTNFLKRFALVFMLSVMLVVSFGYNIANASDSWGQGLMDPVIEKTRDPNISNDNTGAAEKIQKLLSTIAVIFKVVAVAVGIVILIALAMKYMMAAPGDKADVKKSMIPFVVGAFVLFAASGIVDLIIKFSSQLS